MLPRASCIPLTCRTSDACIRGRVCTGQTEHHTKKQETVAFVRPRWEMKQVNTGRLKFPFIPFRASASWRVTTTQERCPCFDEMRSSSSWRTCSCEECGTDSMFGFRGPASCQPQPSLLLGNARLLGEYPGAGGHISSPIIEPKIPDKGSQ